jgi:hypothetical protein
MRSAVATLPNFKFEAQQICLPTPPLKLDPTAAQQGLAVVDRPHAISIINAIWHHKLRNQPTKAAGARN